MRIRLLGGFAVEVAKAPVDPVRWRLRHARTLVAMLALAPRQRLPRDEVIDRLWPDVDLRTGAHNLHQVMYVARAAMAGEDPAGLPSITGGQVLLSLRGPMQVDVLDFEQAAADATRVDEADRLEAAVRAYGGPLLPEMLDAKWTLERRAALAQTFDALRVRLGEHWVAEGRAESAKAIFEQVLQGDPLHEGAVRGLMRVLVDGGRRSEALARYERLRADLLEAFGTDPDRLTRDLYRDLLTGDAPDGRRPLTGALPVALTSVIGRDRERATVAALVRRSRLTTLIGAGGSGKTRLAVEVARTLQAGFEDGTSFVDLSSLAEPQLVPDVVASALGLLLGASTDAVDAVTEQLGDRRALIVLDNCEHLLGACAGLATAIVARCPRVVLLATSREPLRVAGEVLYRVPSLAVPALGEVECTRVDAIAGVASVRLFVDRASQVRTAFRLGPDNVEAVAGVCRRLDGIPLALELAAARTALLEPSEILDRLDDALDVLGSGYVGVPRHETLRAALKWSHDLLPEDERVLLRRLSVFAGTFSLVAVEQVCASAPLAGASVLDLLGRLVSRSLVITERDQGNTRYRLLETVRQFCAELLQTSGEGPSVAASHCAYYVDLARSQDPEHAAGPLTEQPTLLDRDHDNFRAALSWSIRADPASALALAASLWRYWFLRCHVAEGADWVERALEAAPERTLTRAQALIGLTGLDARRGRSDRIRHQAATAVEIAADVGDRVTALRHRIVHAVLVWATFDTAEADRMASAVARESLALGRPDLHAASSWLRAQFALTREDAARSRGELDGCLAELASVSVDAPPFFPVVTPCIVLVPIAGRLVPSYEESLIVGRRVGARQAVGYALSAQGYAARLSGDLRSARDAVQHAVDRFVTLGDDPGKAQALNQLGCILRDAGDYDDADLRFLEARELRRRMGDRRGEWMTAGSRALLAALRGDVDGGRAGAERALSAFEAVGDRPSIANARASLGNIELVAGRSVHARAHYARAVEEFAVQSWPRIEGWHRLILAELSEELGDARGAEDEITRAEALFEGQQCALADLRVRSLRRALHDT